MKRIQYFLLYLSLTVSSAAISTHLLIEHEHYILAFITYILTYMFGKLTFNLSKIMSSPKVELKFYNEFLLQLYTEGLCGQPVDENIAINVVASKPHLVYIADYITIIEFTINLSKGVDPNLKVSFNKRELTLILNKLNNSLKVKSK